jgi:hypothetical protein
MLVEEKVDFVKMILTAPKLHLIHGRLRLIEGTLVHERHRSKPNDDPNSGDEVIHEDVR